MTDANANAKLRRLKKIIEDTCNCPNILQHIDLLLNEDD
jgi:hypothetical protein